MMVKLNVNGKKRRRRRRRSENTNEVRTEDNMNIVNIYICIHFPFI